MNVLKVQMAVLRHVLTYLVLTCARVGLGIAWQPTDMDVKVS